MRRMLAAEMPLEANAVVHSVDGIGDEVDLRYSGDGTESVKRVEYVIAATGRSPNVRGLARKDVDHPDTNGVPVFDRMTMQCGSLPIFIAGDANDDLPLLHEAADEGRIAGENAARYPEVRPGLRRTPLAVVFSDPQLAVVGTRHADLKPGAFVTGAVSFENQGRSRVMLRNRGLLHVYVNVATGAIEGAEMIGPDAEHLAHPLARRSSRMTVERALRCRSTIR
jgi:dihydrolipoamide dehydrogenase